jgi:hypothetical protein
MSYFDPQRCPHGTRWHLACNACRIDAERIERQAQNKRRARTLLDDHRLGMADYSASRVNAALALTGDICGRLA